MGTNQNRLIHIGSLQAQPWKNGGGLTTEIAIDPPNATLEDFRWRVSMAKIERDGPFSAFPGITRWITLVEGNGFILDFSDGSTLEVTKPFEPHQFDGGLAAQCRLINGPCRDLNVMARHDEVMRVAVARSRAPLPSMGHAVVSGHGVSIRLDDRHVLNAFVDRPF